MVFDQLNTDIIIQAGNVFYVKRTVNQPLVHLFGVKTILL